MKKTALFLILVLLSSGCSRREREMPPNELPMYGGKASAEVTAPDKKRNEALIRQTGSQEAAVKKTLDEALATYQRGYFELAMHRYNQAWLMDPKNTEVFSGFGLVLDAMGQEDEALEIYKECLRLNPDHAMTYARLARQRQNKAVRLLSESGPDSVEAEKEAGQLIDEALAAYEKGAAKAALDIDRSFIYYQWAIALAVKQDYAGAWEKVRLSQKYGGQFVKAKFLEALSKDMAEPQTAPAARS